MVRIGVLVGVATLLTLQTHAFADDWHAADSSPPLIAEGETMTYYAPHHGPGNPGHTAGETHYFTTTGDAHHFAWFSTTPTSPSPIGSMITIKYDFRSQGGFANSITAGEMANAVAAMTVWSAATDIGNGPRIMFVQDTLAPAADIVNIGTGDLAALGSVSAPGGILGLGGGSFTHSGATHSLTGGVAWQDFAETWDSTIGNGNPIGTFDYFTVVAQEIGHAIGLGHTSFLLGLDLMDGIYTVEQTGSSAADVAHMQSVYGVKAIPEPGSMMLAALGALGLLGYGWRRRRRAA